MMSPVSTALGDCGKEELALQRGANLQLNLAQGGAVICRDLLKGEGFEKKLLLKACRDVLYDVLHIYLVEIETTRLTSHHCQHHCRRTLSSGLLASSVLAC